MWSTPQDTGSALALRKVMPAARCRIPLHVAIALAFVATMFGFLTEPAHADAASGVCASGRRLGSYTYNEPAYNGAGELMWNIRWSKRWCYDAKAKAVTSAWPPAPAISIYAYFNAAWKVGAITSDQHFTNRGPRGEKHRHLPHYGHLQYWRIDMQHCAVKWALCSHTYWHLGTIGYWDGSKKIIDYHE